jgi:hypothetical protein
MSLPSGSKTFTFATVNTQYTLTNDNQFAYNNYGTIAPALTGLQFGQTAVNDSTAATVTSWFNSASSVIDAAVGATDAYLKIVNASTDATKAVIKINKKTGLVNTVIASNPAFVAGYNLTGKSFYNYQNPASPTPGTPILQANRTSIETGAFTTPSTLGASGNNKAELVYGDLAFTGGVTYAFSWSATNPLPQLETPAAPTVAKTANVGELSVTASAVANASSYTIEYSTDTGTTWTTLRSNAVAGTAYTISGLTGSTHVRVKANATGEYLASAYSTSAIATPKLQLATPGSLSINRTATTGQLSVSFNPVANAASYLVQVSSDGIYSWTDVVVSLSLVNGQQTGVLSGLGTSTMYVRVIANGDGTNYANSLPSAVGSSTPLIKLNKPTIASVEANTTVGQLVVDINPDTNATTYVVEYGPSEGGPWTAASPENKDDPYTIIGLTGLTYVRVHMNGTDGYADSDYSDIASGTPLRKLATPTGLEGAATSTIGEIEVSWNGVQNVSSYLVEKLVGGLWSTVASGITGTSYTITGQTTVLTVRITAVSANQTIFLNSDASAGVQTASPLLNNGGGGGGGGGAVCFLADAPVLTPAGYKPISAIKKGDLVRTAAGLNVAVKRVFAKEYQAGASVNPFIIPKGSFGALRALPISPNHEVMTARGMVQAKELGLPRMKMAGSFTYYNLELEDWVRDNLVVAGVECESLAPATRVTMTKAEFTQFVKARYGPAAAARLKSACYLKEDGRVSMPAL